MAACFLCRARKDKNVKVRVLIVEAWSLRRLSTFHSFMLVLSFAEHRVQESDEMEQSCKFSSVWCRHQRSFSTIWKEALVFISSWSQIQSFWITGCCQWRWLTLQQPWSWRSWRWWIPYLLSLTSCPWPIGWERRLLLSGLYHHTVGWMTC